MKTKRQREIAAHREAREQARRDYAAGFRDGRNGAPCPDDASSAYRTGYAEARARRRRGGAAMIGRSHPGDYARRDIRRIAAQSHAEAVRRRQVRALWCRKTRRELAREARARLAWRVLGALILPALFILATR